MAETVGHLVRRETLTREDVERAAARLFDGQTALPIKDGQALVMPDLKSFTPHVREVVMTTLLLAQVAEA